MSSRKFILLTFALFVLGALPMLMIQPTAAASAGLSRGFSAPLTHGFVIALVFGAGFFSTLLPRDGLAMMPLAFALMVLVGGMLRMDMHQFAYLRFFILGAILCLCLLVGIAQQKINVLAILLMASLGFHLGGLYMTQLPAIASPIYYLMGALLSLGLMLAIAVTLGTAVFGEQEAPHTASPIGLVKGML